MPPNTNTIKAQVYTSMWVDLPIAVKERIAEIFKIPRNGKVHVFDNRVIEDGWLNEDLARLNLESINAYFRDNESVFKSAYGESYLVEQFTDLFVAWNSLIEVISDELKPKVKPVVVEEKQTPVNVNVHVTVDETGKVESITSDNETTHVKKVVKKGRTSSEK